MLYGDLNGGDTATTTAYLASIHNPDRPSALTCHHGFATVEVSGERGNQAFCLVSDPLTAILPPNVAATVVLRGFDIVCLNNPSEGFHTRGFGFHCVT